MANYNSINEVVAAHINKVVEAKGYDAKDYPFQNDINSAIVQLAALYATASGSTAEVAQDAFSITGALDVLLKVVDTAILGENSSSETDHETDPEP